MIPKAFIVGYPLSHSLSPAIQNYWLKQHAIDGEYGVHPVEPEALGQLLASLDENVVGFNITIPHKQAIIPYLDEVDALARKIGAVNTVVRRDGKWVGSNTDMYGFMENLKAFLPSWQPLDANVLMVGAGGAARACAFGLKQAGVKNLTIVNRSFERAAQLAEELGVNSDAWENLNTHVATANLVVNTTSLGMVGQPQLEIDLSTLPAGAAVYDIVYNPLYTPLLQQAKAVGATAITGIGMLLHQARPQFKAWFGIDPEVSLQLEALVLEELEAKV